MALSAAASDSIFVRGDAAGWLQANVSLFDGNLDTPLSHGHFGARLEDSSGAVQANGWLGYSNYDNAGGGDYNVSYNITPACATPIVQGVEHHSPNYSHLNCNCAGHYLYNYTGTAAAEAGYKANTGLGTPIRADVWRPVQVAAEIHPSMHFRCGCVPDSSGLGVSLSRRQPL